MFMTTVKYFERNAALCMWKGEGRCGTGDHCQETTLLLLSCCNGAEQGTHCKGNFLPFSTLILLLVSPILPLPALSHTQEHSLLQLYWKHQQALTAVWGGGYGKRPWPCWECGCDTTAAAEEISLYGPEEAPEERGFVNYSCLLV